MKTVAAISTPNAPGGIAVVRMTGDGAKEILDAAFRGRSPVTPRRAVYGNVIGVSGEIIDEAIAIYMPAPHSYTMEDVCEIQCHGGSFVASRVLGRLADLGAEPAGPGEFTKRAFLNGRLDMAQAEAVMSVIKAENEAALKSSVRQLRGGVSQNVQKIADLITGILADIEAACDFPEEIDQSATAEDVLSAISNAVKRIDKCLDPKAARMITRGVSVALVGRPNTGKSSLLNALSGFERAIVSPRPGTTRDAVTAAVETNGVLLNLTDTAGQRETCDEIENIGVTVAKRAESDADVVIAVIDGSLPLQPEDARILDRADERFIIALNKSDIYKDSPVPKLDSRLENRVVRASAVLPGGTEALVKAVCDMCAGVNPDGDIFTVKRHMDLALEAKDYLKIAEKSILDGYPVDLCAVDVQLAAQSILSIRGANASEEAINDIFSRFCVGK